MNKMIVILLKLNHNILHLELNLINILVRQLVI